MIKLSKIPQIIFASVLALALWTFISINTSAFVTDDEFEYFQYYLSYVVVVGVWAAISFKFDILPKFRQGIGIGLFALTPFFCMHISMILSGTVEFMMKIYFINVMLYFIVLLIFFTLTQSLKWSAVITLILSYIFNLSNYVVTMFRGTPLIPSDFLAIQTAAGVVENYTFKMNYKIVVSAVMIVFFVSLICVFGAKLTLKTWKRRLIAAGCGFVVFLSFAVPVSHMNFSAVGMDVFDQNHANNTHGTLYRFYVNLCRMRLERPDGYSQDETVKLLTEAAQDNSPIPENKPNIIVVMNESFADLSVLGDLETDEEYMPYFNSLEENTIKGELLVSPFGGYTCNTEFEFLTGLSMGLLSSGSAPYLQYIRHPQPAALSRHMKDLGYKSIAMHPYYARGWNRSKVYNLFGFDEFISLEKIEKYLGDEGYGYVRDYIGDKANYSAILNRLEKKSDDERLFIFDITIQNHGGYNYIVPKFNTDIHIEKPEGSYPQAEQYLSLIRESDDALARLITSLEEVEEPVVLAMFGDHQPAIEQSFYESVMGGSLGSLSSEKLQDRYKVPFIIWANYDIEERNDVKTSPNYLSNYILEAAQLPKSKFGTILSEISAEIPQINERGHFTSDGVWETNDASQSELLRNYDNLEYYILTQKSDILEEELQ